MTVSPTPRFLPAEHRRLHRALIDAIVRTGAVPTMAALPGQLGLPTDDVLRALDSLAAADYVGLSADGQIACLYPFSLTPTPHVVLIDDAPRYAMCSIDALGMPAMLDREFAVVGRCAVCASAIDVRVRPGEIVDAVPATALVVARRDFAEPAFAACCPFTVFVCRQEHADQFLSQVADAQVLPLAKALAHAETIFGNLLAEELPAARPRGNRWEATRDG